MNPWQVIGDVIVGVHRTGKIMGWCSLLFQIFASMTVAYLFMASTVTSAVLTGSTALIALASGHAAGMMSAALVFAYFVRTSPLTKGMRFVFPAEEFVKESKTNLQVVEK